MIRLIFGLPGGGKTLHLVREMVINPSQRPTFANIVTRKIKNVVTVKPDMFIKRTVVGEKKDGTPKYEIKFNQEYWMQTVQKHKAINVIIDEAHTLLNPRRAMSKQNVIMTDFLALIRRILGSTPAGYGEATFITHIPRRLDPILREMATQVRHCRMRYNMKCNECDNQFMWLNVSGKLEKFVWEETNATPEKVHACQNCGSHNIQQFNHTCEVWVFANVEAYSNWYELGAKSYYDHYIIEDISDYFDYYDTVQWENLISDVGE